MYRYISVRHDRYTASSLGPGHRKCRRPLHSLLGSKSFGECGDHSTIRYGSICGTANEHLAELILPVGTWGYWSKSLGQRQGILLRRGGDGDFSPRRPDTGSFNCAQPHISSIVNRHDLGCIIRVESGDDEQLCPLFPPTSSNRDVCAFPVGPVMPIYRDIIKINAG